MTTTNANFRRQFKHRASRGGRKTLHARKAFTLVELLVAIAILALLFAMLIPAVSAARAKAQRIACLNQLKQLTTAWQMYPADNAGRLVENWPQSQPTNSWVLGETKNRNAVTDESYIRRGELFPYANQIAIYRCAADQSQTDGQRRVLSYSMNGWMGSRHMELARKERHFRTFVKESELAVTSPGILWVLAEEHETTLDDGWFLVTMNDAQPFASAPADRHARAFNHSFLDGHAEALKIQSSGASPRESMSNAANVDWLKLKELTTVP